ncbi:hypothetical protein BDV19DRAFT_38262 [Aspergillus venezuelensis]
MIRWSSLRRHSSTSFWCPGSTLEWSVEELESFFKHNFTRPRPTRTLLFVDGLDECVGGEVRDLGFFFREITSTAHTVGAKLSVCLSSREYPKVSVQDCPEIMLDRLNTIDIRRKVHQKFKTAGLTESTEWLALTTDIADRSSGVFLWVVIVVDTILKDIDNGKSSRYVEGRLRKTPRELEQLYEQILSGVSQEEVQMTLKFFNWVIFSLKPLRLVDWHHILAMIREEPPKSLREWRNSQNFTENAGQLERQIQSISRGLVEVKVKDMQLVIDDRNSISGEAGSLNSEVGETRIVRAIHSSVSDFFSSGRGFNVLNPAARFTPGDGNLSIMGTCLSYISIEELDDLAEQRRRVEIMRLSRKRRNSEASFGSSASNFSKQYRARIDCQKPPTETSQLLPPNNIVGNDPSLADEPDLLGTIRTSAISILKRWLQEDPLSNAEPRALERATTDLQSLDSNGNVSYVLEDFPALLSYALHAFSNHATIADKAGANPKSVIDQLLNQNIWQRWLYLADDRPCNTTMLYFAVEQGLCSWTAHLRNGTDPNTPGGEHRYPLLAAIDKKNLEAMAQLLDCGALRNVEGNAERLPIHHIAKSGDIEALGVFLKGVALTGSVVSKFLDAVDAHEQTPLHLSVLEGHVGMTESLLALGASPNRADAQEKTVLQHACECKEPNLAICKSLLAHGAWTNAVDEDNYVPSQYAIETGNLGILSLINDHVPPFTNPRYDSQPILTVRLTQASEIHRLKRPYIGVGLGNEVKIIYIREDLTGQGQWNEMEISVPSVQSYIKTRLDLKSFWVISEAPVAPIPIWSVKYFETDGNLVTEEERFHKKRSIFQQDLFRQQDRGGNSSTTIQCLIALEVTIPPNLDVKPTGKMALRDS